MGGDQRTLEKAVHVAKQIKAILEGPRLSLIGIDGHHPRPGLAEHRAPFASRRETGAAKSAQG